VRPAPIMPPLPSPSRVCDWAVYLSEAGAAHSADSSRELCTCHPFATTRVTNRHHIVAPGEWSFGDFLPIWVSGVLLR